MEPVEIPRYIDSQRQFLFWEQDELLVGMMTFTVGVATDTLTYALVAAFFVIKAFKRFKAGNLDGILLHMAYWGGVMPLNDIFKNSGRRKCYY